MPPVPDRQGAPRHFRRHARRSCAPAGSADALAAISSLAGDWTETGLPATIEGAIRSGFRRRGPFSGRKCRAKLRAPWMICLLHAPLVTSLSRRAGSRRARSTAPWRAPPTRSSRLQQARRPLGLRARGRRDHPGRIHPARPLSRRDRRRRCKAALAHYLRAGPGRRMAAGRCFTAASSISRRASKPISR